MPKFWLIFQVAQVIIVFCIVHCSLEKTSQKLGIAYPIFRFFFLWSKKGVSRSAARDRRFVGGSRKTFEKVLSKLFGLLVR